MIISTGLGTKEEIQQAVDIVADTGNRNLCLLKCTSEYPAPHNSMNLRTIPHMKDAFGCPVGLSDHSEGISVPITSVALGACMIEKHFVMSKDDKTVDSFFSLTVEEFKAMSKSVREAEEALGGVSYPEKPCTTRRSLYAVSDIEQGEIISRDNVRNIRPGIGLEPKYLSDLVGRKSSRLINRGEPLFWDMVE